MKVDADDIGPKDLKNETSKPVSIVGIKQNKFDVKDITREKLHLPEAGIESFTTSNKAKDSVFDDTKKGYEKSFFEAFEVFLEQWDFEKRLLKLFSGSIILLLLSKRYH